MAAIYPGAVNAYIPDHDATNKMVVDFARNAKDFAVNRYAQIVPVSKQTGYYLRMTVEEAGRITNTDLSNFEWPDGMPAPEGNGDTESFEFLAYAAKRRAFPFLLGNLTVEQASWDIVAQHARIKAQQAMTARTQLALTAALTTGNWDSSHVVNVTTLTGNSGNWAQSTTARGDIKRSIETAVELVMADTLNAVRAEDLVLVIPSQLAKALSLSQEFMDYIKGSPAALAQIKGELQGRNSYHGMPDMLYGVPLEIEATYKVTSRKGAAATTRSQIMPIGNALLTARPGGLVGVEGSPSFSTLTIFAYREMEVYKKDDRDNERTMGRVVENLAAVVTAPASGVLFTNCAT
jgi:hypothetical protein